MRLVQFVYEGAQHVGVVEDDIIRDLSSNKKIPNSMVKVLEEGEALLDEIKHCKAQCDQLKLDQVKMISPITGCEKVICVGLNYRDHCIEQDLPIPKEPLIFNKFPTSIIANGDDIKLPKISKSVDWEVELAVIIGKSGKHIAEKDAFDHVAGYTVANDVSARDWQIERNGGQWLLGKTFDTFCPLGPALVTKDEITDPHNLNLKCVVNGKTVQDSNTRELVFDIPACIAWVSQFFKLSAGDVLLTGTPPGVGCFRKPPVFLKAGDVVSCEVDGIGKIENKVVDE